MTSYYKVVITNPGNPAYIPVNSTDDFYNQNEVINMNEQSSRYTSLDINTSLDLALYTSRNLETKKDGKKRYCQKCQRDKPDRAHHCSVCKTCILKMDQ
ncbi:hypothetical protein HDU92_001807 [Lobulomyces angularis]|nr:hypothetical protein HDU92_001807 [Lobulomyces angularis]